MGRFEMAVDINRLVEIELPIATPMQGMQNVMRVFGPEAGEDHPPFIGFAIPVRVTEEKELRALPHIDPSIARLDAGRDQQAFGKDRRTVHLPVIVRIFEDQHLVFRFLAGPDLGIDR